MTNYAATVHERVLAIAFTVDKSDDDIESIDSVYFYRTMQDYANSTNAYSPDVKIASAAGLLPSAYSSDLTDSIGNASVGIKFSELIPTPSVIILTVTTQA